MEATQCLAFLLLAKEEGGIARQCSACCPATDSQCGERREAEQQLQEVQEDLFLQGQRQEERQTVLKLALVERI